MRRNGWIALAAIGLLGACSQGGHDGKTAVAKDCEVEAHSIVAHPGEHWPFAFNVRNNGKWCGTRLYAADGPFAQVKVVSEPSHGDVRVGNDSDGTYFAYRPAPNYTGGDAFMIRMDSPQSATVINAQVDVTQ
jgi:hypothetical protein